MADLPANTNQTATQNSTKQDNKFDKLTPILEYSYIVLYNMLNTLRSMKNYVDIYAQDMRLTDLEQYDKASITLEKAIEDLTKAGKNIGSIYGLPEEMLDPQKMAQELARQMKNMPQTRQGNGQINNTQQGQEAPQPPVKPTTPTQPTTPPTPAPEPHPAPAAPKPPVPPTGPSAHAPTTSSTTQPTPPAAPTSDNKPQNASASASDDNEEIQKILEQLKALRQNQ